MENKVKHISQVSLLFGAGLASHCLGSSHESSAAIGSALGLSTHVAEGVFTLGSHTVAHGIYESFIKAKESFQGDVNNDLETAILNTYKETLSQIERDIIEEYKVKEKLSGRLMRYVFNKKNKEYDDLSELKESFLIPLQEALSSDKVIGEMLQQNLQLNPDEFLRKIIEKATPEFAEKDNIFFVEFIVKVCEKFKNYFKHYFLQELKREDKAKTVYFTHLLETIILNANDVNKELSTIVDFSVQANLKLPQMLKELQEVNENVKKIQESFEVYNKVTSQKLDSIQNSVKELIAPVLDKRNRLQYQNDYNKFDFKYGYLNFVGRNDELSRLWNFVGTKDDKRRFLWWMITGSGGIGKSRIAQELCKIDIGYYSGFWEVDNNVKWEIWNPEMPTLIIVDYALSKIDKISKLITVLSQRCYGFLFPVRLLLLDRNETSEWIQRCRPGTEIYDSLYREMRNSNITKLELKSLSIEESIKIAQQVLRKEGSTQSMNGRINAEELYTLINDFNGSGRPLITFFISMAFTRGENILNWSVDDLLENNLLRLEELILRYASTEFSRKIRQILYINTLCGQIGTSELREIFKELRIDKTYEEFKNIYSEISECITISNNECWLGLQPDILGEYFILKANEQFIKEDSICDKGELDLLIRLAQKFNLEHVFMMTYLIWSDFIIHERDQKSKFDLPRHFIKLVNDSNDEKAKIYLARLFGDIALKQHDHGFFEIAERDNTISIELDNSSSATYNNRALNRQYLKRYDEAIADFEKAIELDKGVAMIYYNLASLKREVGLFQESLDLNTKAIELDKNNQMYYNDRGLSKYCLGRFDEAIPDLEMSLKLEPTAQAFVNMGLVKSALNQHQEALQYFEKALPLIGDISIVYFNKALIHLNLKQNKKALDEISTAIKINDKNGDYYLIRATVYLRFGNRIKFSSDLIKAAGLGSKDAKKVLDNIDIQSR